MGNATIHYQNLTRDEGDELVRNLIFVSNRDTGSQSVIIENEYKEFNDTFDALTCLPEFDEKRR